MDEVSMNNSKQKHVQLTHAVTQSDIMMTLKLASSWTLPQSLSGLKVVITGVKNPCSADMQTTVDKYLRSASQEELMRVKDKDANVKFYIRNGRDSDHVSQLLMFVTGIKDMDVEIDNREIESGSVSPDRGH